jgi:hypothetical protein
MMRIRCAIQKWIQILLCAMCMFGAAKDCLVRNKKEAHKSVWCGERERVT